MHILKGAVIAAQPRDERRKLYDVWLCLPTTAENATKIMAEAGAATARFHDTKTPSKTWKCATRLGTTRIDDGSTSDVIADHVLLVLHELSRDKTLRQALRITAWLAGNDLNALFGRSTIKFRYRASKYGDRQAFWLSRCLVDGIGGRRCVTRIDPKVERVLWSLAKVADRAFCKSRSDTANARRHARWVERVLRDASEPFGDESPEVFARALVVVPHIDSLCETEKDDQLGNLPIRSEIWRIVADAAIGILKAAAPK